MKAAPDYTARLVKMAATILRHKAPDAVTLREVGNLFNGPKILAYPDDANSTLVEQAENVLHQKFLRWAH